MSKAALVGLTKGFARDLGPRAYHQQRAAWPRGYGYESATAISPECWSAMALPRYATATTIAAM